LLLQIITAFKLWKVKHGHSCYAAPLTDICNGQYMEFGSNVRICMYSRVACIKTRSCSPRLIIGDDVFINGHSHITCAQQVIIGCDTTIADCVYISDHNHGFSAPNTFRKNIMSTPLEVKPVNIGKRCWIGTHVCILPGVTIGDDCVIGAGSVVTRDIPPQSLAVGIPCKPIKTRLETGEWIKLPQS